MHNLKEEIVKWSTQLINLYKFYDIICKYYKRKEKKKSLVFQTCSIPKYTIIENWFINYILKLCHSMNFSCFDTWKRCFKHTCM